jgi:hypothetical protein
MPLSKESFVLRLIRQTSSQESVFEDREKEFYRRLQYCHSRYYSSVTLGEHSEEDALVIFSLLIPELINLARFVEEKGDAESSDAENIKSLSNKAVIRLCNSIVETFKEAESTLTKGKKDELINNIYSDTDELLNLLPKIFYELNKSIVNQINKYRKILIFQTIFVLMVAATFIVVFCLYLSMPEPVKLVAPGTISSPLKLEYLEKPIKIGYILKTFSGNQAKVIVYFDFYDKSKKLFSRLTYVLSGEKDHWNYSNQTVSGVSYITLFRNYDNIGKEQPVVFENILKEHNAGARRINAGILELNDITSVVVNFQAWYDSGGGKGGDVSVSFYSWDKYVID